MMSKTLIFFAFVVVAVYAIEYKTVDYYAYPKYEFKYGVEDHHTGDQKERAEWRDGDLVKQEYTWGEKDRVVKVAKVDGKAQPVQISIGHHY